MCLVGHILDILKYVIIYPLRNEEYTMNSTLDAEISFGNLKKYVVILISIGIILFIMSQTMAIVPAGHRGVLMLWGAVDENKSLDEGLHFKAPFAHEILPIEVRKRIFTDDAAAASQDLQDVTTSVTVEYRIEENSVQQLWKYIGGDFQRRIISPAIDEVTKQVTANYQAEELVTKRPQVKLDIQNGIKDRLASNNLILTELSITDFQFSELFTQAIESKVEAEQKALKAENDLRRIQVEAQQNEAQAIGDANANIARADGEAEAIYRINEALHNSPEYMEWFKTNRWNGNLPQVTGGAVPFIEIPMEGGN